MTKVIYLLSLTIALFSFILGTLNGEISLFTCFVRSSIVFLGILFVFSMSGQLLKWVLINNGMKENLQIQNEDQNIEEINTENEDNEEEAE